MVYLLLRALLRHALRVFFRDVQVEGRSDVPTDGPLLLAANHPNTMIDVLLVATALDRRVGAVGKAPLFRHPLLGPIIRFLGGVPVERRQEGPLDDAARARNERALQACEEAVAGGGALLIFPEGVSQDEPRLQPLKTGLARIALGAERRAPGRVQVVPVALVYEDKGTFRSRARVRFGQPMPVAPFAQLSAAEQGEPFQAARALTTAVRDALIPDVVHVEQSAHDPLVDQLTTLYGDTVSADAGGDLAAAAAIARAVNAFAATDPSRVEHVRTLLGEYREALARAGVDDRVVRAHEVRTPSALEHCGFYLGAPLALWGIANHLVLYHVPRAAVALVAPDKVYASTVKLTTGLFAFFGCYALQGYLAWRWLGPVVAGIYLATLPLFGLIALTWVEALGERRRASRARRERARLDPATRADLLARRAALIAELDRARAAFLATAGGGTA